jgi:predicted RNA-binding protein YlqC (UPF0109 family)
LSGEQEPRAEDAPARQPSSTPTVEELLAYLVRGLVDHPDEVSVERFDEDDGTILLELSVAEDDYGKVIGRGGRTAQALRTVLRATAAGQDHRVLLDIVD